MSDRRPVLRAADLFCGAGGTSEGLRKACEALGIRLELTVVNHWVRAVETHSLNHPEARHFCAGLDSLNPREVFPDGKLDLLWASPECTHHSIARGGKPINDQSRATAWCVVRWAEALSPPVIMVENVPEFLGWGGIGIDGRPMKSKRGATFMAWVTALESLGYRVGWKTLCAADYGDPTTRKRLFVQAVRGKRRITWPDPSHGQTVGEADLFGGLLPWVAAREIIDWTLPAPSVYARKRPLSPKTMQRILEGLKRFGLGPFIVPNFGEREGQKPRTHGVDEPLPTATSHGAGALATPFIVGAGGPEYAGKPRPVDEPLNTVLCENRAGLVQPYIVSWDHQSGSGVRPAGEPLSTVTTKARHGVAQPFLIELRGTSEAQLAATAQDLDAPLGTVTAGGVHHGLVNPYLVTVANGGEDQYRSRSIEQPAPTVTAGGSRLALAQPFLVPTAHAGAERTQSLDTPLPTVAGNRGDFALVEPSLLPQQSDGRLRPVREPAPTVACAGAVALVEPVLVPFYGTSKGASIHDPLDTVTCTDRFGLALPVVEIEGQRYRLDIGFRMLQPHELSAAQGFPKGYQFAGNKTETVRQIGNAVPVNLAAALGTVALGMLVKERA